MPAICLGPTKLLPHLHSHMHVSGGGTGWVDDAGTAHTIEIYERRIRGCEDCPNAGDVEQRQHLGPAE